MKRGEIWCGPILGKYKPMEQTGRRPVIVWQSDTLTEALQSVIVVPLTTNLSRRHLAGTAMVDPTEVGPRKTSVALVFQMRAIAKVALRERIRALTPDEIAELEIATDEVRGRTEPDR